MSEFVFVAKTDEIPENGMKLVEVDDQLVLVLRVENQYYCIDDICTHDGGTLCDGKMDGHEIICPRHGAKFDIRNGKATKMPATQPTGCHQVKVDGDQVMVSLGESG